MPESSQSIDADETALICPYCGYDLRGSDSARCSECGREIDRSMLVGSAVPWAHRTEIGRLRAYLRTVWQWTLGHPQLATEVLRPQEPGDWKSFARITTVLFAIVCLWTTVEFTYMVRLRDFTLAFRDSYERTVSPGGFALNFTLPWSAGICLPVVLQLCGALFGALMVGSVRQSIRTTHHPQAFGSYAAGPLALAALFLVVALSRILWAFYQRWRVGLNAQFGRITTSPAYLLLTCVPACAILATVWRVAWLNRQQTDFPTRSATLGVLRLFGLWLLGAFISFGLIPWVFGFCWVVIDSLR